MPIPVKNLNDKIPMTAKERVYNGIVQWIIDDTLSAGEKLNEAEIADYFSVSRTPVHEALLLLAEQKMVDIYPSRGSYVTKATLEEADAIFEALSAISSYIALLACRKRTDADLSELERINKEASAAVADKQYVTFLNLDKQFHTYLAKVAGNTYLAQYYNQLYLLSYRYEYMLLKKKPDRSVSVREHAELIEALRAQNEDRARTVAESNFVGVYRNILQDLL